jgi:hypothetical protein
MASGFPDIEPLLANVAARKAAILRSNLGKEGFRLYASLAVNVREPCAEAVNRLRMHFDRPASFVFARAQFTRYQQRPGESVALFVATLRELAAKCNFPADQLDSRVKDHCIAWCHNDRIREQLLKEPDNRTLDQLLETAVTAERAMVEAPTIGTSASSSTSNLPSASVNRIEDRNRKSTTSACGFCGKHHQKGRDNCPAKDKVCNFCTKPGHFATVCRQRRTEQQNNSQHSDQRQSRSPYRGRRTSHNKSKYRKANQVRADSESVRDGSAEINTVLVGHIKTSAPGTFKKVLCVVGDTPAIFILDLGAKVSILANKVYNEHFSSVKLLPAKAVLRNYSGQTIPCVGCISMPVRLADSRKINFNFYVTKQGDSIMGVDLFDILGGIVQLGQTTFVSTPMPSLDNQVANVAISNNTPESSLLSVQLDDYPTLLKLTGRLKGFAHRPQAGLNPSVVPVQQHFWHPPQAARAPI